MILSEGSRERASLSAINQREVSKMSSLWSLIRVWTSVNQLIESLSGNKNRKENNFKLVPINTAEYDEQEIPKSMIARVFEVLGSINRF